MNIRSYSELLRLQTFEERYEYLKLNGTVCEETYGSRRYINQLFYKSKEWLSVRDRIIIRDNGMDLGIRDRKIVGKILVHHINPITKEDILNRSSILFDPENLICVSKLTHEAIHYSDSNLLPKDFIERKPGDTCPWRK